MITDARVLQPEFVPREVVHRDAEVNHISRALEPVEAGAPAETTLLVGPSGAGKTCLARFAVERLRESVVDVTTQYVNCWQNYTRFRALYRVLEGIDRAVDVHRQSTPRDELVARLREYEGPPYVVILDEADQLQDPAVLYDLYRTPRVSMLLIANREAALLSGLDDRVVSRLQSATRVRFDRYDLDTLRAILRARVDRGLEPDAVTGDQLERIADAAAGDARTAIGILRTAARRADREGRDRLADDLLTEAIPAARAEQHEKDLERLTSHQRAVYDLVEEAGAIAPGDLYERYCAAVEDPRTKRTVRNYLAKLEQYDLVASEGQKRGRRYRTTE
jgi:orc1/cdc6 family replication initiation protein